MSRNKDIKSKIFNKMMSGKRYSVTIVAKVQNKSQTAKRFGNFFISGQFYVKKPKLLCKIALTFMSDGGNF